ncbi:hypothetical protein DM860_017814 [Cuscuta australis]|uniref:Uncharacterized protein n=1 Tax=Cuscuta australis TaxID=267555 RepID=A0A328DQS3_9ASTE|nr:hypothetical protein DM860_017814 [Cuscuta australis]
MRRHPFVGSFLEGLRPLRPRKFEAITGVHSCQPCSASLWRRDPMKLPSGEASLAADWAQVTWKGAPERVRAPSGLDPVAPRGVVLESGCLGMQPKFGGEFRPRLNTGGCSCFVEPCHRINSSKWAIFVDPKGRGNPDRQRFRRVHRKGIGLKFLNREVAVDGNVSDSGDVGGGPGKSYLFCLTTCPPCKRLRGGRVQRLEEHRTSRGVRCAPGGP